MHRKECVYTNDNTLKSDMDYIELTSIEVGARETDLPPLTITRF